MKKIKVLLLVLGIFLIFVSSSYAGSFKVLSPNCLPASPPACVLIGWSPDFINSTEGWDIGAYYNKSAESYFETILHTTNSGSTWEMQGEPISEHSRDHMRRLKFLDNTHGWVSTDNSKGPDSILRTTNGGKTWSESQVGLYNIEAFDFIDDNNGMAISYGPNISITSDGGANWDVVSSGDERRYFNDLDYVDENNAWAVGRNKILHITNSGNTIETQMGGIWPITVRGLYFLNKTYGWVVGKNGTIFHMDNAINKLVNQSVSKATNLNAVYFINESTGFVVGNNRVIYKTTDAGGNWINITDSLDSSITGNITDIKFADSLHGWIATSTGNIGYTSDGGDTWVLQDNGTGSSLNAISIVPGTSTEVWAVGDGGVIGHYDGSSWDSVDSGVSDDLYDVDFISENDGWAVGNSGTLLHWGGSSWASKHSPTSSRILSLDFVDHKDGWLMGSYNWVYRTTNGGQTWTHYRLQYGWVKAPAEIQFVDPNYGIIATGYRTISYTSNGGRSWFDIVSPNLVSVSFINNSEGWALSQNGYVIHTSDGGQTWEIAGTINDRFDSWWVGIPFFKFLNSTSGFALGQESLWKTDDSGHTWSSIYEQVPFYQYAGFMSGFDINGKNMWIFQLGSAVNVISSNDSGITWKSLTSPSASDLYGIDFWNESIGLAFGGNFTLALTEDGGQSWASDYARWGSYVVLSGDFLDNNVSIILLYDPTDSETSSVVLGFNPWSTGDEEDYFYKFYDSSTKLNDVKVLPNGTVWVVGDNGRMAFSANVYGGEEELKGGHGWTDNTEEELTSENLTALTFIDSNNGWAVGTAGTILKYNTSSDSGWEGWSLANSPTTDYNFNDVYFADLQDGWIVGSNGAGGVVLRTQDGGETWETMLTTNFSINKVAFTDQENGWAVGDSGKILETRNGGANWTIIQAPVNVNLYGLYVKNKTSIIATGEDGYMLYYSNEAPVAHLSCPGNVTIDTPFTCNASESYDPDGSIVEYVLSSNVSGVVYSGNESVFNVTLNESGSYNLTLKVFDEGGAFSEVSTILTASVILPSAQILSITPNPALEGEPVHFVGNGTPGVGVNLTAYEWNSSIDGFLSNLSSFTLSTLTKGAHTITFRVKNDREEWSAPATKQLVIGCNPNYLVVSPSSYDFGVVKPGEEYNVEFNLSNNGNEPMALEVQVDNPDVSIYLLNQTIAINGSTVLKVSLIPSATTTLNMVASINLSWGGCQKEIPITYSFKYEAPKPKISVTPLSWNMGAIPQGTSATKAFKVNVSGAAGNLSVRATVSNSNVLAVSPKTLNLNLGQNELLLTLTAPNEVNTYSETLKLEFLQNGKVFENVSIPIVFSVMEDVQTIISTANERSKLLSNELKDVQAQLLQGTKQYDELSKNVTIARDYLDTANKFISNAQTNFNKGNSGLAKSLITQANSELSNAQGVIQSMKAALNAPRESFFEKFKFIFIGVIAAVVASLLLVAYREGWVGPAKPPQLKTIVKEVIRPKVIKPEAPVPEVPEKLWTPEDLEKWEEFYQKHPDELKRWEKYYKEHPDFEEHVKKEYTEFYQKIKKWQDYYKTHPKEAEKWRKYYKEHPELEKEWEPFYKKSVKPQKKETVYVAYSNRRFR